MENIKHILCLFYLLCIVSLKAQLVGVYNQTVSISPSYTISNNNTFTVTGEAVNSGTTIINGSVYVNLAIDTSSTSTPKYYTRKTVGYPVSNFMPNATFTFSISDVGSGNNNYKVNGNGTTVIVWVSADLPNDTLSVKDTASAIVFVTPDLLSLLEFSVLQEELAKLPNPVSENILLKNTQGFKIELIDMNGKTVDNLSNKISFLNYSKGLYLLRFRHLNGKNILKKIIIN